jgi:hypothetical protein
MITNQNTRKQKRRKRNFSSLENMDGKELCFNNLELLRHGSFWLYLICVAQFILLSFGSICYCSGGTVMAGIMVFPPLGSHNNLKGWKKLKI